MHGHGGKRCAICTLRSLRRIQRWSVARRLVVPLGRLLWPSRPGVTPSRRRQIPDDRVKTATLLVSAAPARDCGSKISESLKLNIPAASDEATQHPNAKNKTYRVI